MNTALRWLAYGVFLLALLPVHGELQAMLPRGLGVLSLFILPVLGFVVTLVHELGHFAAARQVGAEVRRVVVMPFAYDLRKRRFEMEPPSRTGEVGGYVAYRIDRVDARRKHMLVAVAGPAANLLLAIVLFALAGLIDPHPFASLIAPGQNGALPSDAQLAEAAAAWRVERWLVVARRLLDTVAWLSAVGGIVNLIPFDQSDGAQLLAAVRRTRARRG